MNSSELGAYKIEEKIGVGGMGTVYRGIDNRTGSLVAIKRLKPEIADEEIIARFRREGQLLGQLNHPNIVMMLDAIETAEDFYLVMEYVQGGSLRDLLDHQPKLPINRTLEIALDLCDALTRAHRLDIIHRDLKPGNVLIADDGTPRLSDFGIARVGKSVITQSGAITGTIAYLPPEAFHIQTVSPLFDIWALGVMLFEMLAGERPFQGAQMGQQINAILTQPMPYLKDLRPDVPDGVVDLIYRILDKNPQARIPSIRLVGAEIEAILRGTNQGKHSAFAELEGQTVNVSTPVSGTSITDSSRTNLPAQTTPFVGRDMEVAELVHLLGNPDLRLVTILAHGGMGKTRLSIEVGARLKKQFQDGVYFVELAPISDPASISTAIADAMGYVFQQDKGSSETQLLEHLAEKNTLLIMDNFEHVLSGVSLVNDILHMAPQAKILVTSRQRLNQTSETVFTLGGMEFPSWETPADALRYSGVKLFMQSAKRVKPDFELHADDLHHVARICRLVDGVPLGILLAASWLDVLSPHELAEEIEQSFDILESRMTDLPERQRSIRAVFEYSWDFLSETDRQVFMKLSVFRGGFLRQAAQAVTKASIQSLQSLVMKSLLTRHAATGRYEIHELLRQYAEEKLDEFGDSQAIHEGHGRYYLQFLANQVHAVQGGDQLASLNAIEVDFDNCRAAWTWAVQEGQADLIESALETFFFYLAARSRFNEGEMLFSQARQVWSDNVPKPILLAAKLLVRFPDAPPLEKFRRGLKIAEAYQDRSEIAHCERLIGRWLCHIEYKHDEGFPYLEASLKHFEEINDRFSMAYVLDDMSWAYGLLAMNHPERRTLAEAGLEIRRQLNDKIGMANSLRNLGGAHGGFGTRNPAPLTYWREAQAISYEMSDSLGIGWNTLLIGIHLFFIGDFEVAMSYLNEAEPIANKVGDAVVKGLIVLTKGLILGLEQNNRVHFESAIAKGYPPGSQDDLRSTLGYLCKYIILAEEGKYDEIKAHIRENFDRWIYRAFKEFVLLWYAPALMKMLTDSGQVELAIQLRGLADTNIYETSCAWDKHWVAYQVIEAQWHQTFDDGTYQALWEKGQTLDIFELVDLFIHS